MEALWGKLATELSGFSVKEYRVVTLAFLDHRIITKSHFC